MPSEKKEYIYVFGDADKIRERIEYYLFNGELVHCVVYLKKYRVLLIRLKTLLYQIWVQK